MSPSTTTSGRRRRARLLVATLVACTGFAGSPAAARPAPEPAVAADAVRQRVFAAAASEFGVPVSVLLGVSYMESRWDVNAGRPSTAAGYGPMHLTDIRSVSAQADDARGTGLPDAAPRPAADPAATTPSLQTIDLAARLTGADADALRGDPAQNIRGGAALLAHYQEVLDAPRHADPAVWYGAVARYSGASEAQSAKRFADEVYATIRAGAARGTDDGQRVALPAQPSVRPDVAQLRGLGLPSADTESTEDIECPRDLGCDWIPAAFDYADPSNPTPGNYGNYDPANRPRDLRIRYIVIHDMEGYYQGTLNVFRNPAWKAATQYIMRSSDGHVTQMVRNADVAWQAGNWYINMHSIGIEHEGFLAKGATWYTEAQYRNSARLVGWLARRYGVPLDRAHIVGHDNVPALTPDRVLRMHEDPGPFWDWERYMALLGTPITGSGGADELVTFRPGFASNQQPYTACDSADPAALCPAQGSTGTFLRTEPRVDAPLVNDPGMRPDGSPNTFSVYDEGARVDGGQRFAVADRAGDWTAIWYLGKKAWFHNPASDPVVVPARGAVVTPLAGRQSVQIWGAAFPEASAYPAEIPVRNHVPLQYTMLPGQRYWLADVAVETDYYYAMTVDGSLPGDRTVVHGKDRYLLISFGHRLGFVKASEVRILPSWEDVPQ